MIQYLVILLDDTSVSFCHYQNDKKEITIDVEYIDKYIYIYELTNNIDDNEDYIEKFDLIVNSFMRD